MAIVLKLDEVLKRKGITSKELCELVGLSEANMSILRSGKAKAVRFSTLNSLCYHLDCKPGDILDFNGEEEKEND